MDTFEFMKMEGYEEGLAMGKAKAAANVVKNLLKETDLTISIIAAIADVSVTFVNKIQKQMNSRKENS